MSESLANGLRLVSQACAEAQARLPEGSAERKNLLFAQRLAVRLLGELTVLPKQLDAAQNAFAAVAGDIGRSLRSAGDSAVLTVPQGALEGRADGDRLVAALSEAAPAVPCRWGHSGGLEASLSRDRGRLASSRRGLLLGANGRNRAA